MEGDVLCLVLRAAADPVSALVCRDWRDALMRDPVARMATLRAPRSSPCTWLRSVEDSGLPPESVLGDLGVLKRAQVMLGDSCSGAMMCLASLAASLATSAASCGATRVLGYLLPHCAAELEDEGLPRYRAKMLFMSAASAAQMWGLTALRLLWEWSPGLRHAALADPRLGKLAGLAGPAVFDLLDMALAGWDSVGGTPFARGQHLKGPTDSELRWFLGMASRLIGPAATWTRLWRMSPALAARVLRFPAPRLYSSRGHHAVAGVARAQDFEHLDEVFGRECVDAAIVRHISILSARSATSMDLALASRLCEVVMRFPLAKVRYAYDSRDGYPSDGMGGLADVMLVPIISLMSGHKCHKCRGFFQEHEREQSLTGLLRAVAPVLAIANRHTVKSLAGLVVSLRLDSGLLVLWEACGESAIASALSEIEAHALVSREWDTYGWLVAGMKQRNEKMLGATIGTTTCAASR